VFEKVTSISRMRFSRSMLEGSICHGERIPPGTRKKLSQAVEKPERSGLMIKWYAALGLTEYNASAGTPKFTISPLGTEATVEITESRTESHPRPQSG